MNGERIDHIEPLTEAAVAGAWLCALYAGPRLASIRWLPHRFGGTDLPVSGSTNSGSGSTIA